MNHYPHHIGDFNTATRHLSRIERDVYRDMLDMYYDTECALDGSDFDRLARRLVCVTPDEVAALQFVLEEFFELVEDGRWINHRCEREIAAYKAQQANNGVLKGNEKERQSRSRARRAAIFSALRDLGQSPAFNTKMADLLRLCREHGIAVPSGGHVTVAVTPPAVTRHIADTANQNQNQNQNQYTLTPPSTEQPAAELESPAVVSVSVEAAICMGMKSAGMAGVNPSHPNLKVLLGKGADIGMFVAAAHTAVGKQKGFAYALAIVESQMSAAAVLAESAMAAPAPTLGRADIGRVTVALNPDIEATRRRIAEDAAIPRSGPPPALLERLANRRQSEASERQVA